MQKFLLVSCSLLAALWVGSLPDRALAQAPSPAPTPTSPNSSPSAPVTPDELTKFARVVKQMKQIDDAATQEIEALVFAPLKKKGFTEARMNQIAEYKKDRNIKLSPPLSPEEEQTYDRAVADFTRIQRNSMESMGKVLAQEKMPDQRFLQIFAAVRKDPALQKQVQSLMQQSDASTPPQK